MAGALSKKYGGIPTWGYIAGGVVLVGGIIVVKRRKAASTAAAAPAAATPSSTDTSAATPAVYGGANSGAGDSAAIASILAAQGAQSTSAASSAYAPPTGETLLGSGYYVPNSTNYISSPNGSAYQWISSFAQAQPLIAQGQTLYYQPTPGTFAPATANSALVPGLGANTPLFVQATSSQ